MKSFKLFLIGCKMVFLPQISAFYYSVALLCSAKKLKFGTKIHIFRFNQKSLNDFDNRSLILLEFLLKSIKLKKWDLKSDVNLKGLTIFTIIRPFIFVTQSGFEPETYCLEGSCSIQLSYWAKSRGGRIRTCGLLLPKQAR
jgi:hypothetical protein